MSKHYKFRFGVGSANGPQSNIWVIAARGDDIYVSNGTIGGIAKLSIHQSGICRSAFTSEYGIPKGMTDRAIHKWRRAATPPAGTGRAAAVLRLYFADDFLSKALTVQTKPICWISAVAGGTRVVELVITNDDEQTIRTILGNERELVSYGRLRSGEAVCVLSSEWRVKENDFVVPSSHHEDRHLVISASDPNNTSRPVRILLNDNPKDGDVQNGWEFGGYWQSGELPGGINNRFNRSGVYAKENPGTK